MKISSYPNLAQISLSALYLFVDSIRIHFLIFEQDCYQRLEPNTTLQALTTECERIISLKEDTALVEQQSKSSYTEQHVSLGLCRYSQAQLFIKPGLKQIFRPKRPVPHASLETVEKELDRLEAPDVISKVNYSVWAAPIVVIKKANGSTRICADFSTGLNEAIQTHQYSLPLPEDILATLARRTVFFKD